MAKSKDSKTEDTLLADLINDCSGIGSVGVMLNDVYLEITKQANPSGMYSILFRDISGDKARECISAFTGYAVSSDGSEAVSKPSVPVVLVDVIKPFISGNDGAGMFDVLCKFGLVGDYKDDFATLKPAHFAKIADMGFEDLKAFIADRVGEEDCVANLANEVVSVSSSSSSSSSASSKPVVKKVPTLVEQVKGMAEAENGLGLYSILCDYGMERTVDADDFKSLKKPHFMKLASADFDGIKAFIADRVGEEDCVANLVNELGSTPAPSKKSGSQKKSSPDEDAYVANWDNRDEDNEAILKELQEADKPDDAMRVFLKYGCPANKQTLKEIILKFIQSGNPPKALKDSNEATISRGVGRVVNRWLADRAEGK